MKNFQITLFCFSLMLLTYNISYAQKVKSKKNNLQTVESNTDIKTKGEQIQESLEHSVEEIKDKGKGKGKNQIKGPKKNNHPNKGKGKENQEKPNLGKGHGKHKGNNHPLNEHPGKGKGKGLDKPKKLDDESRKARLKMKTSSKELKTNMTNSQAKLVEAKQKINAAKMKLEADKKAGTITNQDYQLKSEKIKRAEKGMQQLQEKMKKAESIQPN